MDLMSFLLPQQYAFCSWGHVTKFFRENSYTMGYNLKNARNGKKWKSVKAVFTKENTCLCSSNFWQIDHSFATLNVPCMKEELNAVHGRWYA